MLEQGDAHWSATDHVIESFRNDLWPGYKTGDGIDPAFVGAVSSPRGSTRRARRRDVGDGRARGGWTHSPPAAQSRGARRTRREGVHLDAGQGSRTVRPSAQRVVQIRSAKRADFAMSDGVRREIRRRARAHPPIISRSLGDSADGYPGLRGLGTQNRGAPHRATRPSRGFPPDVPRRQPRIGALVQDCSRRFAPTPPLFRNIDEIRWRGPTSTFAAVPNELVTASLGARCQAAEFFDADPFRTAHAVQENLSPPPVTLIID
jgi:hypothetical protein